MAKQPLRISIETWVDGSKLAILYRGYSTSAPRLEVGSGPTVEGSVKDLHRRWAQRVAR